MARAILIIGISISASMTLGALIGIWRCSRQRWCPRYLKRQLDAWHRQMARQYAQRRAGKITVIKRPTPPSGEHAA